jgi:hypothetical protein
MDRTFRNVGANLRVDLDAQLVLRTLAGTQYTSAGIVCAQAGPPALRGAMEGMHPSLVSE